MGVLLGIKFEQIISPAIILPHASRLRGLMIRGLFSFIEVRGVDRG